MASERITTSDGTEKYISFPKIRKEKEPFKKVFSGVAEAYLETSELDGINVRVVLFILMFADGDNIMDESDIGISRALGLSRQCVWESIKRGAQMELWLISTSFRTGRRRVFVNPYLICKCGPTQREKLCKGWNELIKGASLPFDQIEAKTQNGGNEK